MATHKCVGALIPFEFIPGDDTCNFNNSGIAAHNAPRSEALPDGVDYRGVDRRTSIGRVAV